MTRCLFFSHAPTHAIDTKRHITFIICMYMYICIYIYTTLCSDTSAVCISAHRYADDFSNIWTKRTSARVTSVQKVFCCLLESRNMSHTHSYNYSTRICNIRTGTSVNYSLDYSQGHVCFNQGYTFFQFRSAAVDIVRNQRNQRIDLNQRIRVAVGIIVKYFGILVPQSSGSWSQYIT